MEFAERIRSGIYGNTSIVTGTFDIDIRDFHSCGIATKYSDKQKQILRFLGDRDLDQKILKCTEDEDQIDGVFFVYKSLNLNDIYADEPYDYFIFFPQIGLWSNVVVLKVMLYLHIFSFWFPYFIFANFCYIVICVVNIQLIGGKMTRPIIELTKRLNINITNIRKLKKR